MLEATIIKDTKDLISIIDFIRYGLTLANSNSLYYGHGTDNALDDLYSLILGALSLPMNLDPMYFNARLTEEEKKKLTNLLCKRIINKIPVPYLINKAYFCGLPFFVDERVLIPRSPIAELIEECFEPWIEYDNVSRILDLCTGSGCIAIAAGYAFENAMIDASDLSTDALKVAEINRKNHHMEERVSLIQSDVWDNIPEIQYDIIISNPPYVSDEEMQTLPKEYAHEPILALKADNNGLFIVDKILKHAKNYLSDKGILIVEVGNTKEALVEAYPDVPFTWLDFKRGGEGVFLLTKQDLINIC